MVFSFSAARLLFFVNFAPIVSIIILVAFIKTNVTFSDTINRVFFLVCAAAFLLVVADSTRFVTARMEHPGFLRYFSKSFWLYSSCKYNLFNYSDCKTRQNKENLFIFASSPALHYSCQHQSYIFWKRPSFFL